MIRKTCFWMLLLSLVVPNLPANADDLPYRRQRSIISESVSDFDLTHLILDSDVYSETRDGFPDLRIFDSRDKSQPFILRHARDTETKTRRVEWRALKTSLRPLPEGGLQIFVALEDNDPQPSALRIVTPLTNFEHRIRVFNGDEDNPMPLVEDAVIFDYSQFMDVRQVDIPLPQSDARNFRIFVDAITADQESRLLELTRTIGANDEVSKSERTLVERRPFRIDQITLIADVAEERRTASRLQSKRIDKPSASEDTAKKQTVVEFSSDGQPLSSIRILTPDRNFSRLATLQTKSSDASSDWQNVASTHIARFQMGNLNSESLEMSFEERRTRLWRITIDNRDSPPIQIDGIEIAGPVWEVVFVQARKQSYRLMYGAADVSAAQHDTFAVAAAIDANVPMMEGTLGEVELRDVPEAGSEINVKSIINNPVFLVSIVVLVVAALTWALFGAARRVQQVSDNEQ
ncbi:MAG: DUF3999 family protein [Planctomyces sp.]|nr:DUF3999 family protein [Planctomyces sp.]